MKTDSIYELSSVVSFFLRENGIESMNLRYLGFFHGNYIKQNQASRFWGLIRPEKNLEGDARSFPWRSVSSEEYNFCVGRLAKYLSEKERLSTLLLLLDISFSQGSFLSKRLQSAESIAARLNINKNKIALLKDLIQLSPPFLPGSKIPGGILLLRESEFYLWKSAGSGDEDGGPDEYPVLAYRYFQEEMLAFVKIFQGKAALNGSSMELNKAYPMSEGDVLTCNNKVLTFNGLFRHYFNCAQFQALKIAATEVTPEICFDPAKNHLRITGCSVPDNGIEFYSRLTNWLENYLITKPSVIKVDIRLDYFNTTSSKCILDFLFRLQSYKTDDINLEVNWFFQDGDEDLEEAGLNYSEIITIPFTLVPYN